MWLRWNNFPPFTDLELGNLVYFLKMSKNLQNSNIIFMAVMLYLKRRWKRINVFFG
jgi:hypothetical protein